MVHVAHGHLNNEGLCARNAMTFENFGAGLSEFDEVLQLISGDIDANERKDVVAARDGIDFGTVSANDARVFEIAHALGDRRGGESDATTQFSEWHSGVLLQLLKDVPTNLVEQVSCAIHGYS